MFYQQDHSHDDIWQRLSLFLSRDVVARRYQQLHGLELNAGGAKEIIAYVAQGRDYFLAAAGASNLVRPLLQYYGVLAFARGLILFRTPRLRDAALAKSHGLRFTGDEGQDLGVAKIEISNGTFLQLLEATENSERIWVKSSMFLTGVGVGSYSSERFDAGHLQHLVMPKLHNSIAFLDALVRLPSIKDIFEAANQQLAKCHFAVITKGAAGIPTEIALSSPRYTWPSVKEMRVRLAVSDSTTIRDDEGTNVRRLQIPNAGIDAGECPPILRGRNGGNFLVEPYSGQWALSTLATLFVISFALSNLVRYHPAVWMTLSMAEKGDALLPLLAAAADSVQVDFPSLVLQELEDPLWLNTTKQFVPM